VIKLLGRKRLLVRAVPQITSREQFWERLRQLSTPQAPGKADYGVYAPEVERDLSEHYTSSALSPASSGSQWTGEKPPPEFDDGYHAATETIKPASSGEPVDLESIKEDLRNSVMPWADVWALIAEIERLRGAVVPQEKP